MRRKILIATFFTFCLLIMACGKKESTKQDTIKNPDVDLAAHEAIELWTEEVPFEEQGETSTILPYLVDSEEPVACMIICPGGAYQHLAVDNEGIAPAEALNEKGISAFVLNYRISPANHEAIMEDVLRAIRFVRYYAEFFNIDPDRVGVMGFSAGGHLSLMALEHFDMEFTKTDAIDDESSKPALGVLCYPVVSMGEDITHVKTKTAFLGDDYENAELVEKYSGELQVREDMPPFFVWHSRLDSVAPVDATLKLIDAADEAGVECEDLIFDKGPHGAGMAEGMNNIGGWFEECASWLSEHDFCKY